MLFEINSRLEAGH